MDAVTAFAPASVSNLGPGFDILGLAVEHAGDRVTAIRRSEPGVRVEAVEGDEGRLPRDPERNTASVAAAATLARAGIEAGVGLIVHKGLPIGSGLGSSAASAVAAAVATNALVGGPLRKRDLLEPCLEAEAVVAGRHADNVAPALLGGLVLVRHLDPLDLVRLPVPEGLWVAVATPAFSLETKRAREVLPDQVSRAAMVAQAAHLGALVSACHSGDLALLGRSIVDDVIAPHRIALIPGAAEALTRAQAAGALGASVSGAGPSLFALCRSRAVAERCATAMTAGFAEVDLGCTASVSPADCPGARLC